MMNRLTKLLIPVQAIKRIVTKIKGVLKTYKFFDEYETVEIAQTVLKNEGWKYECKKVIKFETKICYRCGEEKSRYVK